MAQSMLETASVLKEALSMAHQVMEGTMADVDDELANRPPAGQANPIGACYLHILLSEDWFVSKIIRQEPRMSDTSFEGKTGADQLPAEGDLGHWYRGVQVDLSAAREYAKAVFSRSEEAVGSLSESELNRETDLGFYNGPLAACIELFLTGHCNNLCGEISALKGTFGHKGYPF